MQGQTNMMQVQQVEQIDFNNLQHPPNLDETLISQMDASINSKQWSETYHVITMLRSINKFFPQFTPNVMGKYSDALLRLLSNGKPMIVKNIVKLVKQVFSVGKEINVEQTVERFLSIFLKKSATDIGQSKQMAQEVLTAFSCNCGYDVSFKMTAQACVDKNAHIAEMALKLLNVLVQNIGGSITQLNPNTLKTIMIALSYLIDGKRADFKNTALEVCFNIFKSIGSENYMNLMNYSLDDQKVQRMGVAMETYRCSKAKPVTLKDRKTMMMKNIGNLNMNPNFNQNQNTFNTNNQNFNPQQNGYIMGNQGNNISQSCYNNVGNGFRY